MCYIWKLLLSVSNLGRSQHLRKEIESLNKDLRDKQREIQSKEAHARTAREDLTKAESKLAESQKMSQNIIELNDEIRKLQSELENQEELVSRHAPVIQNKEKELFTFQSQVSDEESMKVADVSEVKHSMTQLASLEKEVQRYVT